MPNKKLDLTSFDRKSISSRSAAEMETSMGAHESSERKSIPRRTKLGWTAIGLVLGGVLGAGGFAMVAANHTAGMFAMARLGFLANLSRQAFEQYKNGSPLVVEYALREHVRALTCDYDAADLIRLICRNESNDMARTDLALSYARLGIVLERDATQSEAAEAFRKSFDLFPRSRFRDVVEMRSWLEAFEACQKGTGKPCAK